MLVTCRQMQEIEARAFASGASEAGLMHEAGAGIARAVKQFFPRPGTLRLYLGSGHNAGDALVAGRLLLDVGWQVEARLSVSPEQMRPLPRSLLNDFTQLRQLEAPIACTQGPLVILDGLLGIGAQGPLRPALRMLTVEMNQTRLREGAFVVALDIPTGLNGDDGVPVEDAVQADLTVTVAVVKKGLVADGATAHVGRLALVPLPALQALPDESDHAQLLTPDLLRAWLPRRPVEWHKGLAGRVGIVAGSPGFWGAALLAGEGALRAGAGLVTLWVKPEAYDLFAQRAPAEVMVRKIEDYREVMEQPLNALAVGPGLGFDAEDEYLDVLQRSRVPMVIDADALTALSKRSLAWLANAAAPRLLTPHPGEMARLLSSEQMKWSRRQQAESAAAMIPGHTVLLKGARTVIATADQPTGLNSTGHSGMATGGMGDVLSGVAAALIGQGIQPHQAAGLAAWLCGRAAERAALMRAMETVLPRDVIEELGGAWQDLICPGTV